MLINSDSKKDSSCRSAWARTLLYSEDDQKYKNYRMGTVS